jgi:hypothetical protein
MLDCIRVEKGTVERVLAVFVDSAGALLTGLTVAVRVQRSSDGKYLESDDKWSAVPATEHTAAQVDATNRPGEYIFSFSLPDVPETYEVRFDGGSSAANRYQFGAIKAVADAEGDLHAAKAVLANRQEQDIATGVVTVMDDDDVTPLLTLTPTVDDEENPTKNILAAT